ncbi:MAG: hypothetical protein WCC10_13575 [Tumebacillaceae bacterium]
MKRTVSFLLALSIVAGAGQTTAWAETPDKQAQQEREVNYAALLETEDVEYFLQKAEEFSTNDPSATLEQINDFLKKEMKVYYSKKLESNTIDYPVPTQAGELNPQEQALYNSNPYYGLQSLSCGQMALSESKARYTNESLVGGNGDAFRHAYWSAAMVLSTSLSWAEQWGTAHEEGAPTNDSLNKSMDLTNNYRGRQIGSSYSVPLHYVNQSVIADVINWVDSGKMVRIVGTQLVSSDPTGKL